MRIGLVTLWLAMSAACAFAPIEDGATVGPVTQIKSGFTSCFLWQPEGAVVLFDACNPKDARTVEEALAERGLTVGDVDHVLLTHGHPDHTGGLQEGLTDVQVWAHPDDAGILEDESPHVTAFEPVADGELLSFGAGTVEVLHTPGHTPGSVVYVVDGVAVMGDVAISRKDGTLAPPPRSFSEDPDRAETALVTLGERLADREPPVTDLVFAHGGPLEGLDALTAYTPEE